MTRCQQDPELFFTPAREAEAVAACSGCPLVEACGERGQGETYGVWGGSTPLRRAGARFSATTKKTRARDAAFADVLALAEEYGLTTPGQIATAAGLRWSTVAQRMNTADTDLDRAVMELRAEGLSLREAGLRLGITKDAVGGIVARLKARGKIAA